MQNNDQAKHWKARLEDDTAFEGQEIINSHAAWDILYNRMQKPRRTKAIWYWMAAACFFSVLLSAILIQAPADRQQETVSVKPLTEIRDTIVGLQQNQTAAKPAKKNVVPGPTKKRRVMQEIIKQEDKKLTVTVSEPVETLQEEILFVPVQIKERGNEQPATVQAKQVLKVVHINELGGNAQNSISRPGGDYSVIQVGVNNKTTQSPGKIGIKISTAKTSPAN